MKVKMAEASEVQALSKISSEVDESQINVILTNQCIKAQKYLLEKLKKQSERHKEECGFISSANLKLECEIKQAELEIQSLRQGLETIKHANVELKKDYLLAKEKNYEIAERINAGEKKYEQLWLESKSRYESIPFVKKLLQAQNRLQSLNDNLANFENQTKSLVKEIEMKSDDCKTLDKKRIIGIAEFMIHDVPIKTQIIQEKLGKINDLSKEIETIESQIKANDSLRDMGTDIMINKEDVSNDKNETVNDDHWANLKEINDEDLMVPKFDETDFDLDIISNKLEKIKKVDIFNCTQIQEVCASSPNEKDVDQERKYDRNILSMEPYISPYFIKKIGTEIDNETRNTNKKLINILDDVNIRKRDVFNILSKVNPKDLQEVNIINSNLENFTTLKQNAETGVTEITCSDNIVVPPSQFLDSSQEKMLSPQPHDAAQQITAASEVITNVQNLKSSQDAKKVTFNLSSPMEESENPENLKDVAINNSPLYNDTLDISAKSDEDFVKIKDMILKKHNLESSPQFVYAKNTIQSNNNFSENIVKSKFFEHKIVMECDNANFNEDKETVSNICSDNRSLKEHPKDSENKLETIDQDKERKTDIEAMEVDNIIDSENKINVSRKEAVGGLLFTHTDNAIPESLDVSITTTGYDDSETDFPHFIDSNLLLSPKADIQIGDDNSQVKSQEVPNFLSGLRKTGLSLFGDLPSSSPNTESNNTNQHPGTSFKFTFGSGGCDEKKSRGGFFNMFN